MKKLKSTIVCLATLLCVTQSTAVFASSNIVTARKIPAHMNPGTVIQYDSNKNMKVLKKGVTKNDVKAAIKDNNAVSSELPNIEANTTVTYDALGTPIVVGGSSESKGIKSNFKDRSSGSQQGYVSWYDIWSGGTASGSAASDGAAHKTLPFYTSVTVYNENRSWSSTRVRILDRGPYVRGRILDMSQESFSKVANLDDGIFYGEITW